MPIEILAAFFVIALLLGLTPGPDNIFVLGQSLAFGSRAGLWVTLGLCTGLLMHTALVAVGLAALMLSSVHGLLLIKLVGAGYLVYLAWQSWCASTVSSLPGGSSSVALSSAQLYRRGIIMNATNPKVTLFFIAFLPQFVDESYGSPSQQIILLGALFILSTVIIFGAIALLAGHYSERINRSVARRGWLNRILALIFMLLALNLLWTSG